MPSRRATARASPAVSAEQQLPKRRDGSALSSHGGKRSVTPITSYPCATSNAAATEESTPPLMPTTMRSLTLHSEKLGQSLQLVGRRVADLDPTVLRPTDDPNPGHDRALDRFLQGLDLGRAVPRRRPGRAPLLDARLGRAHGPRVREDLIPEPQLIGLVRQCQQRTRMAHGETPLAEILLDHAWQA